MKNILIQIKNLINQMLFKFGYRISKVNNSGELVKIHKYKDYNEYRETQIFYNKKKIDKVWADEITLEKISDFLKDRIKTSIIKGICHGSRNGFEQNFFNEKKDGFEVIGTDISDTAKAQLVTGRSSISDVMNASVSTAEAEIAVINAEADLLSASYGIIGLVYGILPYISWQKL